MKRKLCIILLALCVACTTAGCGSKGADSPSAKSGSEASSPIFEGRLVSVSAKELEKIVELSEYKGISVDKPVEDVTDAQVDDQINYTLSTSAEEVEDPEAAAAEGDIVNIDYVGTKDGVAFDGGTYENYDLTLGAGQFIDGFEEGLIGAKKGEKRDLNLTFPEGYTSAELAGQDVVFAVTVNAIKQVPKLSEEWVQNHTEYDTIDAYRQGIREEIEESNQYTAQSVAKNNAWNQVLTDSNITEYPDEDLDAELEKYRDSLNTYAEKMGQSLEEFLKAQGMTQEQAEEQNQEAAQYKIKQRLVTQAIMDKEGFSLDDEGNQEAAEQMVKDFGSTLDEMIEQYGEDTVKETVALARVMDFIIDNAEIHSAAGSSDEKEGILADEDDEANETENAEE